MSLQLSKQKVYICIVLLASFASVVSGLSLEELRLEMEKVKQHDKEVDVKVRRLQQNEVYTAFF